MQTESLNYLINQIKAEKFLCKIRGEEYLIPSISLWRLEYLARGKRYPLPKKCRSYTRMSKKWREQHEQGRPAHGIRGIY